MKILRLRNAAVTCAALLLVASSPAQDTPGDKVDLDVLSQIKTEAFQHSQVMENLFYISEVYGPRVNNSRNHRAAAEWAMEQMKEWGLQNVHLEKWPFGYGWQIKKYYGALESPAYAAIPGFPLAWTPGTDGPITADAMWAPIHSKEDFPKYRGKLKGKIVLIFDPAPLRLHTTADARPPQRMSRFLSAPAHHVAADTAVVDPAAPALQERPVLPEPNAIPAAEADPEKAPGNTRPPRWLSHQRRIRLFVTS